MNTVEELLTNGFIEDILKQKKFSAGYLAGLDNETKKDVIQSLKLFVLEYFHKNKDKCDLKLSQIKAIIYRIVDYNCESRAIRYGELYRTIWGWIDNREEFKENNYED